VESNLLPGNCLTPMLSRRHSDPVRLKTACADFSVIVMSDQCPIDPGYDELFSFSAKHLVNRQVLGVLCFFYPTNDRKD
jgi:hypothetical protein